MSQNAGTLVIASVRVNDSLDTYPSAYANEIKGGIHSVSDDTERDAITVPRRMEGMLVYVASSRVTYQLGADLTTWTPFSGEAFDAVNKEGSSLAKGKAVAIHSSGTGVVKAHAEVMGKQAIGLIGETTANTFAGRVQTKGLFALSDWTAITGTPTLTRGPYYVDAGTPGGLSSVAPTIDGQLVQIVGYAVSPTTLDITPQSPILL